jgi:hypothetical protein
MLPGLVMIFHSLSGTHTPQHSTPDSNTALGTRVRWQLRFFEPAADGKFSLLAQFLPSDNRAKKEMLRLSLLFLRKL